MHRVRAVAAVLFGLSLLFPPHVAFADAIPYPSTDWDWGRIVGGGPRVGGFSDASTACTFPGSLYVFEYFTEEPWAGKSGGYCWYSIQGNPGYGIQHTDVSWTRYLLCERGGHPDDIRLARPMCICPPGYDFDTSSPPTPGWGTFACKVSTCPVDDLQDFPPANDTQRACSVSLEANNGLADPAVCPAIPVMTDQNGEPCLRRKLATLGISYAGPTSTIRTPAYQAHLREVWDKFWEHQWLINDPVRYEACTAKRAIVENEQSRHGLAYAPATDSRHLEGRAFDISQTTVGTLRRVLAQAGQNVTGLLRAPPACNLDWGGDYRNPDYVHFETP